MAGKKEELIKLLDGKTHIYVNYRVELEGRQEPLTYSRVSVEIKHDYLVLNGLIAVPVADKFIKNVEGSTFEISYIDPDGQVVHVTIVTDLEPAAPGQSGSQVLQ